MKGVFFMEGSQVFCLEVFVFGKVFSKTVEIVFF